ncbi:MAG TPA: hypothetical protein PLE04_00350 [Syntrophales bacterium]|nr:hypothetical protein [Syntrophales bacterium]
MDFSKAVGRPRKRLLLRNNDGFVKSPYAVLPFFPRPCGVPEVRLSPRDSGALPMELFTLPFEKVLNWPFYDFINNGIMKESQEG